MDYNEKKIVVLTLGGDVIEISLSDSN